MANIVVTTSEKLFKVSFNDYKGVSTAYGIIPDKRVFRKDLVEIQLTSTGIVKVHLLSSGNDWRLSTDGSNNTFTVDTIDGVSLASNEDLYNKLVSIIE